MLSSILCSQSLLLFNSAQHRNRTISKTIFIFAQQCCNPLQPQKGRKIYQRALQKVEAKYFGLDLNFCIIILTASVILTIRKRWHPKKPKQWEVI